MVPREGTTHLILAHPMTLLDLPRHTLQTMLHVLWRNYRPNKGSSRSKTHARCSHSCKEFSQSRVARLRHNLISNSLSIILSQWMVWILVFYPQVGPMHHPRPQVLNLVLWYQNVTPQTRWRAAETLTYQGLHSRHIRIPKYVQYTILSSDKRDIYM